MNTPQPSVKLVKREYWKNHVQKWRASGQTSSDYCQQHQLKRHQLVYWMRIFSDTPVTQGQKAKSQANGFVKVQVVQPSISTEQDLVIELPSGLRITGVHSNNLNLIQEIIRWKS